MTEPYLGMIITGGWTFAPRGYAMCQGQLLSVAQNTALFSLLGTAFGGNGIQTFGLPDLRGRVAVGQGTGPGLQPYALGQVGGTENTTLLTSNMPAHTHAATVSGSGTLNASSTRASQTNPTEGALLARATDGSDPPAATPYIYIPSGTADVALGGFNVAGITVTNGIAGGSQPFSILQPFLVLTQVIAINGIFPSRN